MLSEVYIGDIEDPDFNYEKGNWNGNIPKRIGPCLSEDPSVFKYVIDLISNEKIVGKQTDWGAWVAPLFPNEIYEVFQDYFSSSKLTRLQKRLVGLEPNKKYGLVACEFD